MQEQRDDTGCSTAWVLVLSCIHPLITKKGWPPWSEHLYWGSLHLYAMCAHPEMKRSFICDLPSVPAPLQEHGESCRDWDWLFVLLQASALTHWLHTAGTVHRSKGAVWHSTTARRRSHFPYSYHYQLEDQRISVLSSVKQVIFTAFPYGYTFCVLMQPSPKRSPCSFCALFPRSDHSWRHLHWSCQHTKTWATGNLCVSSTSPCFSEKSRLV